MRYLTYVVLACALLRPEGIFGQGPLSPDSRERDRYHDIKRLLASNNFRPQVQASSANKPMGRFCADALGALISGDGVRVIAPTVEVEDLTHPRLQPWVRCWKTEDFIRRTGAAFGLGTRSFRLYRADVDRNAKNGQESILYAEWDHRKPPAHFGAGFTWMDTHTCEIHGGAPVHQRDTRDADGKGQVIESWATLVYYKEDTWALEAHGLLSTITQNWSDPVLPPRNPGYYVSLTTLASPDSRLERQSCTWSTVH